MSETAPVPPSGFGLEALRYRAKTPINDQDDAQYRSPQIRSQIAESLTRPVHVGTHLVEYVILRRSVVLPIWLKPRATQVQALPSQGFLLGTSDAELLT
jgi:hypothetical protein